MSVIKSQRSTSPVEFINTARQLEIYTIQKAVGFPKRYTFYVSQPLANYVLTFDFSKFFDRVSHALVEEIVRKNFSDTRLIGLIMDLINAFGNEGLGLGSQVSQVFALASANRLDHYCKEVLRIHGYGRYMDDGYLISESKDYLKTCLGHIQRVCNELHITLNLKKTKIIKLSKGFTFLKCRFYLTKTGKVVKKIYKTSVTKRRRKLKKFLLMMQSGVLTMQDVYQAFQSWRAYARHFDAWHTIKSMERLFDDLFVPGLVRG